MDGVFVPDGGPIQQALIPISSTGLFVTGIADVKDGIANTWDYIWNGMNLRVTTNNPFNFALGMHANKGITFDLDKIEDANPGLESSIFSGGLALGVDPLDPTVVGLASLYVIVDGVIKESVTLDTLDAVNNVSIPINSSDRFLTLLAVSNGGIGYDHTVFLDPRLTLVAVEP